MSLVPTYVQSSTGRWYKNPVVKGEDWFVCWDDDEPIELVIQGDVDRFPDVLLEISRLDWGVLPRDKGSRSGKRLFDGEFKDASRMFLTQVSGPPDEILIGDEVPADSWNECVLYYNGRNGWKS